MGLIHVCEDVKTALPKEHLSDIEARIRWEGHEAEAWLAARSILVMDQWVRGMCESGCPAYDTTPFCPPHLLDIEEAKRLFEGYDLALIIRYSGFHRWKDVEKTRAAKSLSELVPEDRAELRRRKDLRLKIREISDYIEELGYETFPMSAGHCRLCEPPACRQEECRQPHISMPAVEGMGVHVFQTMARLGHEMHYLPPDYSTFSFYNAILINSSNKGSNN